MRSKLLALVFALVLTGVAISPVHAQAIVMPDLTAAGYVEVGSLDGLCAGDVTITRHEWQLEANQNSDILDAISFSVDGNEYLVVMFWYVNGNDYPVRVTFYTIQNGQVSIQWLTYDQLMYTAKNACDYLP